MLEVGNDIFESVEILEAGRGAIFGQLIDARSDITDLALRFPEKVAAFDRPRELFNDPSNMPTDLSGRLYWNQSRVRADDQLEACIEDIREQRDFERFLLGPSREELKLAAVEGPIVIVNISQIRSDSIIITHSGVRALHLPRLTEDATLNWMAKGLTAPKTRRDYGKNNAHYRRFLSWLWDSCVGDILRGLEAEYTTEDQQLFRIWWIGVGAASSLPFHAAGIHAEHCPENTMSRGHLILRAHNKNADLYARSS